MWTNVDRDMEGTPELKNSNIASAQVAEHKEKNLCVKEKLFKNGSRVGRGEDALFSKFFLLKEAWSLLVPEDVSYKTYLLYPS